jgi:hypothetical protein
MSAEPDIGAYERDIIEQLGCSPQDAEPDPGNRASG